MQASRFLKHQRAKRRRKKFPISIYTIVLLGFSLLYSILHIFTLVPNHECRYGLIWIGGWFDFTSLFQVSAFAISLLALLFIIRLLCLRTSANVAESLFQAALVCALILVLLTQKAFLFPYATPSWAEFERVAKIVSPSSLRLVEENDPINLYPEAWVYDYPPPPNVEFEEDPRWSETYNRRISTIFKSKNSPLWSEFKGLKQCDSDLVRAVAQWKEDEATLKQYWEGFREWYAVNRWRYEN